MKKIMKIFFVMCFGYQAYAQDTTKILDSLNLPQVDMQLMNDAKMSWMGAYTGKTDNKLFPGLMFVGSGLGNEMTSKKYTNLGNATFMVPILNEKNDMIGSSKDVGKIVKDQDDFNVLFQ